ncbi:MAG: EamA family transporter RarD, partial [Planctomycetes bacterium]|nr:EamA family transporter RarD [Planctomycetota bacterium]
MMTNRRRTSSALSTGHSTGDAATAGGPPSSDSDRLRGQARAGVFYGLAAYLWWGLVPIYFKAVAHVPAPEILAHRVVWAFMLLAILMRLYGKWPAVPGVLRDRGTMVTLFGTTMLIALNWFVFIWAVANDKVLQASLGYFINPLFSVFLGVLFLRERLRPAQQFALILAAAGVIYLVFDHGSLPWVAIALPLLFGLYGLIRKHD